MHMNVAPNDESINSAQIDDASAAELDADDPLRDFRAQFHIPRHNGRDMAYFCGNSLGLQPKGARLRR